MSSNSGFNQYGVVCGHHVVNFFSTLWVFHYLQNNSEMWLRILNSLMVLGFFISTFWVYDFFFFWLIGDEVTGWYYRKLALSLKLPSVTWMWALVLHNLRVLCIFLEEEPENCPKSAPLILDCSFIFSTFPPSLISNCLNLLFGTQERMGGWMKAISYKQEIRETESLLHPKVLHSWSVSDL